MIADTSSKIHQIQFILYTLFCFSFMALSLHFPQVNASFQSMVVDMTTPVLHLLQKPSEWVTVVEDSVTGHVGVYEENKQLKDELAHKQRLNRDLAIIHHENDELRRLLNMTKKTEGKAIAARVISDKKSAFSHTVIVNVGLNQNVEKGQVVINEDGIVGRVLEVFDTASRVLLLTDYASRIPVKILETRVRGIVRGTNSYNLELVFTEEEKAKIKEGMVVVTTGAGGIFVEGIPVGTVRSVGKSIYIKPDIDFENLDLISIQRQEVKGIL